MKRESQRLKKVQRIEKEKTNTRFLVQLERDAVILKFEYI